MGRRVLYIILFVRYTLLARVFVITVAVDPRTMSLVTMAAWSRPGSPLSR